MRALALIAALGLLAACGADGAPQRPAAPAYPAPEDSGSGVAIGGRLTIGTTL